MCLITRMAPVALSCQLWEGTASLHNFKSYSKMDGLVALVMALDSKRAEDMTMPTSLWVASNQTSLRSGIPNA